MMKLTVAFAAAIFVVGISVSAHAATVNDGNGSDGSVTQTQKVAPKQHGANATTTQNRAATNARTNTAQAPIAHTWDDQTEETAKMPGTTGPRNTPKGGAGLSYPSTK